MAENHVQRDYSKHINKHTYTSTHLIYTELKQIKNKRLEVEEDSGMEQKTWQVYCFGKRHVLRFDLNESREGPVREEG